MSTRWHRPFGLSALALLGMALACLALMPLDPREVAGVSTWVKPAKFSASFALWFGTLALLWPALSEVQRRGRAARAITVTMLAAAWFEQGWITLRAALGLPSHFAQDSLGAAMYPLMGVGATLLVVLAAVLGAMVLRGGNLALPAPRRLAAGLGLVLTGVLGGAAGWAISLHGGPWVGGTPGNAGGWPPFHWSRDGGDLRVAHFLGLHAMQALPLLALLRPSPRLVWGGGALLTLACLGALALALAGVPLA